jgi:Fe2+ transport system protein FeoA
MQLSFKKAPRRIVSTQPSILDLAHGEHAILDRLELPREAGHRLMELGFLPGTSVTAAHCAPGGDPRVFRVDGSEIALRAATARHLKIRHPKPASK